MADILTPEKLRALGLEGLQPGAIERVDAPEPPTGEARGVRETIVLAALLSGLVKDAHFLPAASPAMHAQGVSIAFLHENPGVVRVQTLGGDHDLAVALPKQGVGRPDEDPGTVYWDTSQSDSLELVLPTGVVVALESRANGVELQVAETLVQVRELADINAPLNEWAAACPDVWLAAELRRCSSVGGRWHNVVGAGMLARLFESPLTRTEASSQVQPWQLPRAWGRKLSEDQRATIVDLGLAEADALHLALDAVSHEFTPGVDGWLLDWTAVCHRRDDLASAYVVLAEAGGAPAVLQDSLALLDRRGRRALFNVPRDMVTEDERLRRIRLVDPVAWWGSPEDVESVL
jgi:hypothetical protein